MKKFLVTGLLSLLASSQSFANCHLTDPGAQITFVSTQCIPGRPCGAEGEDEVLSADGNKNVPIFGNAYASQFASHSGTSMVHSGAAQAGYFAYGAYETLGSTYADVNAKMYVSFATGDGHGWCSNHKWNKWKQKDECKQTSYDSSRFVVDMVAVIDGVAQVITAKEFLNMGTNSGYFQIPELVCQGTGVTNYELRIRDFSGNVAKFEFYKTQLRATWN